MIKLPKAENHIGKNCNLQTCDESSKTLPQKVCLYLKFTADLMQPKVIVLPISLCQDKKALW